MAGPGGSGGPPARDASLPGRTGALLPFFLVLFAFASLAGAFVQRRDPNIMEARNLLCARDILRGGNWLFPALDGKVRLQKPPLPTWLSASSSLLFGKGRGDPEEGLIMRIPAFITALAGVLLVFLLAREWGAGRMGALLAGAALATSWAYTQWGIISTWDVYAFVFGLAGVYALDRAFRGGGAGEGGWGWSLFSGLLFGLSGWSKGPVAFFSVLLPYLLACLATGRTRRSFRWSRLAPALLVGLLLGSGWWILAWFLQPQAGAAFREETYAWGNRHVQDSLFYIYGIPRYTLPWTLICLAGLGAAWRKRRLLGRGALWFLFGLLLLSIVPEKKMRYALPLLFPLALLVGTWLGRDGDPWENVPKWVGGVCRGHRALLVLAGPAGAGGVVWGVAHGASPAWLLGAPVFLFFSWWAWRHGWHPARLGAATAGAGALAACVLLPALSVIPRMKNRFHDFSEARAGLPGLPLYKLEDLHPCITWAMDPVGKLRGRGELPGGAFLVLSRKEEKGRVENLLAREGRRGEILARPVYIAKPPEVYLVFRVSPRREEEGGKGGKEEEKG